MTLEEIGREWLRLRAELSRVEAERDEMIRQAAEDGLSLRRIAAQAGVSHQRVAQILEWRRASRRSMSA